MLLVFPDDRNYVTDNDSSNFVRQKTPAAAGLHLRVTLQAHSIPWSCLFLCPFDPFMFYFEVKVNPKTILALWEI